MGWAAVAVLVVGDEVLFIERAQRPGDPWSGDMAFPGGFADRGDPDPLATARREVDEELGLGLPSPVRRLPWRWVIHPATRRPTRVVPYVFRLSDRPDLSPDRREVADAVWIPLAHLATDRRRRWIAIGGLWPWRPVVWVWQGRRIWGRTGRMVDDLLAALGAAP